MLRLVLTFGIIGGLITGGLFWLMHPPGGEFNFDSGQLIGYATMVIAFLTIPIAIRQYRDKELGGQINFKKSFQVGILITLVASLIYTLSWEAYIATTDLDFAGQYAAHMAEKYQEQGLTEAEMDAKLTKLNEKLENYQNNTLFRMFFSFAFEIFPIGLLMTLLSAFFLGYLPNRKGGTAGIA